MVDLPAVPDLPVLFNDFYFGENIFEAKVKLLTPRRGLQLAILFSVSLANFFHDIRRKVLL